MCDTIYYFVYVSACYISFLVLCHVIVLAAFILSFSLSVLFQVIFLASFIHHKVICYQISDQISFTIKVVHGAFHTWFQDKS